MRLKDSRFSHFPRIRAGAPAYGHARIRAARSFHGVGFFALDFFCGLCIFRIVVHRLYR